MSVTGQIENHLHSLPDAKRIDAETLHVMIQSAMPGCQLWFLDGKDESGKVVSNPNIGYGNHTIRYTDGSTKEFYRIGISANSKGISIYIFGIDDKNLLPERFGNTIGKAKVTGYCIAFKKLADLDAGVLNDVVAFAAKM